jgi:L-lactate dehydrogenase complex protein LldG
MSCRQKTLSAPPAYDERAEQPLSAVPLFDEIWRDALLAVFKQSLDRMGGVLIEPPDRGDVLQPLRGRIARAKVVCSMVPEIAGNRSVADASSLAAPADVHLVILRALLGVAGTGSVLLDEGSQRVDALTRLAKHVIVLLDPEDIVLNLQHAFRLAERRLAHHADFKSDPSVSAQIAGMLIHPTRDVRRLSVLPVPRRAHIPARFSNVRQPRRES